MQDQISVQYSICRTDGEVTHVPDTIDGLGWDTLARLYRETEGRPETIYSSRNIQEVVDKWTRTVERAPLIPLQPKAARRETKVVRVDELMRLLRGEQDRLRVYRQEGHGTRMVRADGVHKLIVELLSED